MMFSAISTIPDSWPATVAKVTVLLGVAALVSLVLYRASAAVRHLVWLLALASCVVLAVAAPAVPRIDVPIRAMGRTRPVVAPEFTYDSRAPRARPVVVVRPQTIAIAGRRVDLFVPIVAGAAPRQPSMADGLRVLLIVAWLIGFLFVAGRARLGHSRVASLVEDAQRLISADWRNAIRVAAADVGITRAVDVLESDEITSPMTSGFLNPVIVLPTEARSWDAERRHVVLVHELAHVARFDYFAQLIATAVCAIFWFHPFAWLAAARLRAEAEQAADDHVLNAGTMGVTYATHLLDLARRHNSDLAHAAAVGMVRSSRLEGRFRAMLDSSRSRAEVSSRFRAVTASLTLCAMIPIAGLHPVAPRRSLTPVPRAAPSVLRNYVAAMSQQAVEAREARAAQVREARKAAAFEVAAAGTIDSLFEKTIDASAGDKLTLDLRSGGAIVIHGWDEPRIRVVGRLAGRDWRETRVSLERVPGGVRLRSDMESVRENSSTAHQFELWVPRHTNVELSSAGGSLAINDLSGEFRGRTGGGGITIEDATGSASLSTGGGEIAIANSRLSGNVTTGGGELTVTNVTGGLRGSSGSGSVIVSNGDGPSTVRGGVGYGISGGLAFGGTTSTITKGVGGTNVISGSVRGGFARGVGISSGSGPLTISKAGGEIVIDGAPDGAALFTGGGRIIVGPSDRGVTANTGGGDIVLEDVAGDASATTGAGDVRISVSNSRRSDQTIEVESGKGQVVIEVPATLDARIELESAYTINFNRRTSITSDFPLMQELENGQWDSSNGTPRKYVRATGVVGNGRGLIRVRTVNGDVVLKRVNR